MEAHELARQRRDISPFDALRLVVNHRAEALARVERIITAAWDAHRRECEATGTGNPDVPPKEVRQWMQESRAEARLLAQGSKLSIDAGVADALVRRWELEGRLVTDALVAGLDALELSPDDRLRALARMHTVLAGSSGGPLAPHAGATVIDQPLELEAFGGDEEPEEEDREGGD